MTWWQSLVVVPVGVVVPAAALVWLGGHLADRATGRKGDR